jgi:hypothetical protein
MVSRGCAGSPSGFDDIPPLRARACPLRARAAGSPVAFAVPLHAPKQGRRASRGLSPLAPGDRRPAPARGTPRPGRACGGPSPRAAGGAGVRESSRLSVGSGFREVQEADLKRRLHATERDALLAAWSEAEGNVSQVSRILGVSRPTVYRMLREHGLKV